jgi:hypothetical protein
LQAVLLNRRRITREKTKVLAQGFKCGYLVGCPNLAQLPETVLLVPFAFVQVHAINASNHRTGFHMPDSS